MAINCDITLSTNPWCLTNLADAAGEDEVLILIPTHTWQQAKNRWLTTPISATPAAPNIFAAAPDQNATPIWAYSKPQVTAPDTVATALFPTADTKGLYFAGDSAMFSPSIAQGMDADGVLIEQAMLTIPFGSTLEQKDLIKYIQVRKWNAIRKSGTELRVYGGQRGMGPVVDEMVMQMFSGNNDVTGKALLQLTIPRAGVALEIIRQSAAATNTPTDLDELFSAFQTRACMPNVPNLVP